MRLLLISLVAVLAVLPLIANAQQSEFGPPDRTGWPELRMVKQICGGCHALEYYVRDKRSFKIWQLVLENMRNYAAGSATEFSRAEADQLADYLSSSPDELKTIGEHESWDPATGLPYPKPASAQADASPATEVTDPATLAMRPERPRRAMIPMAAPPKSLALARITSYIAVAMLLVLLVTGAIRKKIRASFSPIHHTAALLLFVTIAIHASIHLVEFGPVPVLWLWFGIAAIVVLLATEGAGLLRKQLKKRFLRLHMIGGTLGLLLTILHWIWAYL